MRVSAIETLADAGLPAERFGDAADRARYAVDGTTPPFLVFPRSVAEIQSVLRAVADADRTIIPAGLGAHLCIGAPPRAVDGIVSTARLDRVIEHAVGDLTVTALAGTSLATLDRQLARAGQWLPIDPPAPGRTSIGGLVGANLSGPARLSQGSVRDLLLGLRVVRADGTLIASGGRVVKNVAGYDLHKAFIGALGTLGIVVEATFKVRPRPEATAAIVVRYDTVAAALALATAVRAAVVDPLWLTIASPDVLRPGGAIAPDSKGACMAIGLAGTPRSIVVQEERITTVVRRDAPAAEIERHPDCGPGGEMTGGADPYRLLRDFAIAVEADALLIVMLLPTEVAPFLADAGAACRPREIALRFVADPGIARLQLALRAEASAAPADDRVAATIIALRALATVRRGHLSIRSATPAVKRRAQVWGEIGPGAFLMQRLRATFDPERRFCPGRFVDAT